MHLILQCLHYYYLAVVNALRATQKPKGSLTSPKYQSRCQAEEDDHDFVKHHSAVVEAVKASLAEIDEPA